jgi:hypothetical protein
VSVARKAHAQDPEAEDPLDMLALALYHQGERAADAKVWELSAAADEESIALYRILAEVHSEEKYGPEVITGLSKSSEHLSKAGDLQAAIQRRREQVCRNCNKPSV